MSELLVVNCCCDEDPPCWVVLYQCCGSLGDFPPIYMTCATARLAGIGFATFGGFGNVFKWQDKCWIAGTAQFPGGAPPPGSSIVGDEIVGQVGPFYERCQPLFANDEAACCNIPTCWYKAVKCCNVAPFCAGVLTPGVPPAPAEFYVDCATIEQLQFSGNLPPFPFSMHLQWFNEQPDCIPCYTFTGASVGSLPPNAVVETGVSFTDLVANCTVAECCPQPSGPPCPVGCSMPTHIVWDVVPAPETVTCLCSPPLNPQSWKIGGHDGPFECVGDYPVSTSGCGLWHYGCTFNCGTQFDQQTGAPLGIVYTASVFFKQASTYDINADCVPPGGCAYQFPGQNCADPCNNVTIVNMKTPLRPIGSCPNPADFFVVSSFNVKPGTTPSIVGFS